MSTATRSAHLAKIESDARASLARSEQRLAARGSKPAAPGDLYLIPQHATSDGVEWLLLERQGRRCLLVAADTNPLVGSQDLRLEADDDLGFLAVRCNAEAWATTDQLSGARRSGVLSDKDLESVRRFRRSRLAGVVPESDAQEVDRDPAYRDWMDDVVLAAARRLGQASMPPQLVEQPSAPARPAALRRAPERLPGRVWGLAASALIAVGATILAGQWRGELGQLRQEKDSLHQQLRMANAAATEARAQEALLARRLSEVGNTGPASSTASKICGGADNPCPEPVAAGSRQENPTPALATATGQAAAADGSGVAPDATLPSADRSSTRVAETSSQPLLNPRFYWLQPQRTVRSNEDSVQTVVPVSNVPDPATRDLDRYRYFQLESWTTEVFRSYRVELFHGPSNTAALTLEGLEPREGAPEVIFALPDRYLPQGDHQFRLWGQEGSRQVELETFHFKVAAAP